MQQYRLLITAQQGTCCYLPKVTQLMGPGTIVVFNESIFKASGLFRAFMYSTPKSFQLILINIYLSSSIINLIKTNIIQGLAKCMSFYLYLYKCISLHLLQMPNTLFQAISILTTLVAGQGGFFLLFTCTEHTQTYSLALKGVSIHFILPLIYTILEPYTHEYQVFLNVPLEGMNESHIPTSSLAL